MELDWLMDNQKVHFNIKVIDLNCIPDMKAQTSYKYARPLMICSFSSVLNNWKDKRRNQNFYQRWERTDIHRLTLAPHCSLVFGGQVMELPLVCRTGSCWATRETLSSFQWSLCRYLLDFLAWIATFLQVSL